MTDGWGAALYPLDTRLYNTGQPATMATLVLHHLNLQQQRQQSVKHHNFAKCQPICTKFKYKYNLSMMSIMSTSVSVQSSGRTCSSSLVTLARPSVYSSLQITNRSFRYASPLLWNQLPSSFHQPHCVRSPPGSPHPTHITSSQSSPSFSPSVTPSTFHSRLKNSSLSQILSSIVTLIPSGLPSRILTCTVLKGALALFVLVSFSGYCAI